MTNNALSELDALLAKIAQILGRPLSPQEVSEAISQSAAGIPVDAIARSIEQFSEPAETAALMERIMLRVLREPQAEASNVDRVSKSEPKPKPKRKARIG